MIAVGVLEYVGLEILQDIASDDSFVVDLNNFVDFDNYAFERTKEALCLGTVGLHSQNVQLYQHHVYSNQRGGTGDIVILRSICLLPLSGLIDGRGKR